MKKLINDPADVVADALHGIEAAHPELRVDHAQQDHLPRRRARPGQGRASSPAAARATSRCTAGSSGSGMLDAACAGEVFTSPVPDQMLAATKLRRRRRRRPARREELHRRRHELRDGRRAGRGRDRRRGRRPSSPTTTSPSRTACTRPAAAASASPCCWRRSPVPPRSSGRTLDQVAAVARAGQRERPQHGRRAHLVHGARPPGNPTFDLPEDEMEVGVGIHGEPGRQRVPLAPAREIAELLVEPDPRRPRLHRRRRRARVRQRAGRHAR